MWRYLLVAIGGALGAVMRYEVALVMKAFWPAYPASGTLLVNVVGSFMIGFYLGTSTDSRSVSEAVRLFFVVGVLGGLTTFSSLTYETVYLTRNHPGGLFTGLGHLTANVILGLAAVWIGAWFSHDVPTR